jgi:hypothetical protein
MPPAAFLPVTCLRRDVRVHKMSKPSLSSGTAFYAILTSFALVIINCLFLRELCNAFLAQSVFDFVRALGESAWAQATLSDFFCGAVVLGVWIGDYPGERVLGCPHILWAFAVPFFGNPVAALYIAIIVLRSRDVLAALVPYGTGPYDEDSASNRNLRRTISTCLGLLFACYCAVLLRAFVAEPLVAGFLVLKEAPLVWVTFLDNLVGVLCVALLIGCREGATLWCVVWLASLAVFGHGTSLLYTLILSAEAERQNSPIGAAWATFSPNNPRSPCYV